MMRVVVAPFWSVVTRILFSGDEGIVQPTGIKKKEKEGSMQEIGKRECTMGVKHEVGNDG